LLQASASGHAPWFVTAEIATCRLFVGASAAVVRAPMMGAIAVWGEHHGLVAARLCKIVISGTLV